MNRLRALLELEGILQSELAAGIGLSESFVSLLLSGKSNPSIETIDATLAFLCVRLGRSVKFEEIHQTPEECK